MRTTARSEVGTSAVASLRNALKVVGVTNTTPFSRDGRQLDVEALRTNLRHLVDSGIQLIFPCGNTGEFSALTLDEWTEVVEVTVDVAGGAAAVVPGIGGPWRLAIEMVARAASLGASGVLLMPLTHPYASESGAVDYYASLCSDPRVPGVLYRRGEQLSAQALRTIIDRAHVAGIKYASHNLVELSGLIRSSEPGLVWGCGLAETWAPFYTLAGARGFTSGLANFAPRVSLSLWQALDAADYVGATDLADQVTSFEAIRTRDGDRYNVAAVKYAMKISGLGGGPVRAPLAALDARSRSEVREAIRAWQ
jgi:4-hydroxy-tetrahydrodipicolinate synthase